MSSRIVKQQQAEIRLRLQVIHVEKASLYQALRQWVRWKKRADERKTSATIKRKKEARDVLTLPFSLSDLARFVSPARFFDRRH